MILCWQIWTSSLGRRGRDRLMTTSTSSFSRRLCLVAVTMAFVTGIVIGILLPIYVPSSSTSSLPLVPLHDVYSSGDSKTNYFHYDDVNSKQWNKDGDSASSSSGGGGGGAVFLKEETRNKRRAEEVLQRYDDVRLSGSLNDPDQLQGGTPHGALSWPVLDTSPPSSTSTMSFQQQQLFYHHHPIQSKSNQDGDLGNGVRGQDRLNNRLHELTSGTAPSNINHTSLNAKFRQQLEAKIINRRLLKSQGMATSSLSSSSLSSTPPPDWHASRWSQFSKGRLKRVEKMMTWNDLLLHPPPPPPPLPPATGEETSVKQLVAKKPSFLQQSSSNTSSNNSKSTDLVTIEHSNADSLGDISSEIQLSLPTTSTRNITAATPSQPTTSLLLPKLFGGRRRSFMLPKGKRLELQRGVTTQRNSADLVTIGLPQIIRPIPLQTQVKLQVENKRVLLHPSTSSFRLDLDDKSFLDLSSSPSDKTSSKEDEAVINNPDDDGSYPSEDAKSSSLSALPHSTFQSSSSSKGESLNRPLFQPWHFVPAQLSLGEDLNSTNLQIDNAANDIRTIDSLISDGVYWSELVEAMLPSGFSSSEIRQWIDYASGATVVKVMEGCGRMQNRLVVFDNGTQSCCRYRQNNDQIQGDIFSFYLSQLLGLSNLPPATLGLLHGHERQWRPVRSQLTLAQWNEQKPIVMTKFVDNLVPAHIPKHFRGDGPQERRRLHPLPEDLLDLSSEELQELAQFSDLVIFDYLTANLDRVVNNMYNRQWNPDMMTAPAHNLAKVSKTGLLVFLDNESGLLHGYRLLDKYETYHKAMLDGLCVFRRSTARAVKELHRKSDVGFRLKMALLESQPHMTEWLPLLPEKSVKILQERLARVVHQIQECESQYVLNEINRENRSSNHTDDDDYYYYYDSSLSNPLKT